jgi:hypothetical protein
VRTIAALLLALLALAAPASASEHVMRVNEVGLSVEGGAFVELLDVNGEPFPSLSYKLAVYGPGGAMVGETPIDKSAIVGKRTPVLVSSQPTVGGQSRDIALTVALPADGQACFESNIQKIHCLAWGNVPTKLSGYGAPTDSGPAPPAGQSLARCPSAALVGAPSPRALNPCVSPTPPADRTKPVASVTARTQKLGAVLASGYRFGVRSNERGTARAQLLRRGRVVASATRSLSRGVLRSFALRPSKPVRDALVAAQTAVFVLKVRVTDAAGNFRDVVRTVTVRR